MKSKPHKHGSKLGVVESLEARHLLTAMGFAPRDVSVETPGTRAAVLGDIDGDGDLDIVTAVDRTTVAWHENTDGAGTYGDAQIVSDDIGRVEHLVVGDINGDDALDIVVATRTAEQGIVAFMASEGGFEMPVVLNGDANRRNDWVSLDDVDEDGDLDLLTAGDGGFVLHANTGVGEFGAEIVLPAISEINGMPANQVTAALLAGDVDNDGDRDIVSLGTGSLSWYANEGDLNFAEAQPINADFDDVGFGFSANLALGDLDMDGDLDIAFTKQNSARLVVWYKNDGSGGFGPLPHQLVGGDRGERGAAQAITTADMDGDGDTDVVVTLDAGSIDDELPTGHLSWLENQGDGQFSTPILATEFIGVGSSTAVADVDSDGDLDIVSTNLLEGVRWHESDLTVDKPDRGVVEQVIDLNTEPIIAYANQLVTHNGHVYYMEFSELLSGRKAANGRRVNLALDSGEDFFSPTGNPQRHLTVVDDALFMQSFGGVWMRGEYDSEEINLTPDLPEPGRVYMAELEIVQVHDSIYFNQMAAGSDRDDSGDLWVTDKTVEGTELIAEFGDDSVHSLTGLGNLLYFVVASEDGDTIWRTDGTVRGTEQAFDQQFESRSVQSLTAFDGELFFSANGADTDHGVELWRTTGAIPPAAGVAFTEDFSDGNAMDGSPVTWTGAGTEFVVDSDENGSRMRTTLPDDANIISSPDIYVEGEQYGDVSIHATMKTTAAGTFGLSARNSYDASGSNTATLYSMVDDGGSLFLGAFGEGQWFTDAVELDFSPHETDVELRFDIEGNVAFFKVWPAGTDEPAEPLLTAEFPDWVLPSGNVGWWGTGRGFDIELSSYETTVPEASGVVTQVEQVADLRMGEVGSTPEILGVAHDVLYLSAETESHGRELWGVAAGSDEIQLISDVREGEAGGNPTNLMELGGGAVFSVEAEDSTELWHVDPATNAITLVQTLGEAGARVDDFMQVDELVYFSVVGEQQRLWLTDGTVEGTRALSTPLVAEHSELPLDGRPFTVVESKVVFAGFEEDGTTALFVTDGTDEETFFLEDTSYKNSQSATQPIGFVDGKLLAFATRTAAVGEQLFAIQDGEAEVIASGFAFGIAARRPQYLNDRLTTVTIAFGDAGAIYTRIYTDGTADGTTPFFVHEGSVGGTAGRSSDESQFFFGAWLPDGRSTLYVSDTLNPGDPVELATFDINVSGVYGAEPTNFVTLDDGSLWKTDGTAEGTVPITDKVIVHDVESGEYAMFTDDALYFIGETEESGKELWLSDGTDVGTRLIKDIRPGAEGANINWISRVGDSIMFAADDGEHGVELWKTDGTEEGTVMVADINAGTDGSGANPGSEQPGFAERFTVLDDTIYFEANDGIHGDELWKSDGTAEGTQLVYDVVDNGDSGVSRIRAMEDGIFFRAWHPDLGGEPWYTDGTKDGTFLIVDVQPGRGWSWPDWPNVIDEESNTIYFTADDGEIGFELYRFTPPEAPLSPKPGDINEDGFVNFQDFLLLATNFGDENSTRTDGDLDGSGTVDFQDFLELARNFEGDVAAALAPQAIDEAFA